MKNTISYKEFSSMNIPTAHREEIVRILSSIFPGVLIYCSDYRAHAATAQGKKPEIDLVLDVGRKIGDKDIKEAQKALAETHLPYTIYLYDMNGISENERKTLFKKETAWKL